MAAPPGRKADTRWLVAAMVAATALTTHAMPARPCGDCDGNGIVSITDALAASQHASGLLALPPASWDRCNVLGALAPDPGAAVDVLDSLTIAQAVAGLPNPLQCTPALLIETMSLCDGVQGSLYTALITASGGTGSGHTWAVSVGSLPPGLALAPAGTPSAVVSGAPSVMGAHDFTIEVRDSAGHVAATAFRIEILPTGTLALTTCDLPTGSAGSAYAALLEAVGGTEAAYSWEVSSGSLPPGLALDARDVCATWGPFATTGLVDQARTPALSEISGVAASRRNPGVLWVHDDSGAGASFFAIDETGAILQRYDLATVAVDWEDIALGPGPDPMTEYLYLGDVGDNSALRSDTRILRVEEPILPPAPASPIALAHEEFYFNYPAGPRDCETVIVDWETAIVYLVEKRPIGASVHRFPGIMDPAWTAGSPVVLVDVSPAASLPLNLTGGDASRDGRRVILRNYGFPLYEFVRPAGASFEGVFAAPPCAVAFSLFHQYEAVAYSGDGTSIYTLTEISLLPDSEIGRADAATGPLGTMIAGTPTTPGIYDFEVQVTDSSGASTSRMFRIVVGPL